MSKITLLVTSFNGLSQSVYTYLKHKNHIVDVVYINSVSRDDEIDSFSPDIILSPFLKHYIPKYIYEKYPTFVFHPGVVGDRGAYAIEWALWSCKDVWGGVWLRADEEFDGGDIYASGEFKLRDTTKSSVYRQEMKNLCIALLPTLFENIKTDKKIPQIKNPIHDRFRVKIDWQKDTTRTILKKINTLDSYPGVLDELLGVECYMYGGWVEEKLKGSNPKEILVKRDGAVCLSTVDGAIWVTHLKEVGRFKLPATYVLKDRLKGVKEDRLPLIFDKSYKTFYEISCDVKDDVAYLYFDFHNGAFSSDKCMKLKYAFEYVKTQAKVVVLMGGEDFFSNGIHLNILEDSKKNGEDGWSNINAMNDLVRSILFADDVITVASLTKNCGAGGVFLALVCDFVVGEGDVVLNPHYKSLGLSGSEYHTYILEKRCSKELSQRLLDECLPISVTQAKEFGLVDEVFCSDDYMQSLEFFCSKLVEDEDGYDDFLWDKEDFLEQNRDFIESKREKEIAIMHPQFWDLDSEFHKLRYEFVYKVCPTKTPQRLKRGVTSPS